MKKAGKMRLGVVLAVLIITCIWHLPAIAADVLKIAVIDPVSGPFAAVGDQSNKQYEMIAEILNAQGGILGKKLEMVFFDNKNVASESLFQLRRAIDQGISIICQGHSSGVTAALSDAIAKHNERNPDKRVIYFCPDSTDPTLTNERCNFWLFRWGPTADQKIAALVRYLAQDKNMKNVFLINMDYSHGHGVSAASRRELQKLRPDVKIVGDTFHAVGKIKDFSPYVNSIKGSEADTIITGNWGVDLEMLIKSSHDAGLKVRWATLYAGVIGSPSAMREAGLGTLQVTTWHMNVDDGKTATTEMAIKFKQKYGVDFYYQEINTMFYMLKAAVEKAKSFDPLQIGLALEGMKIATPTGEVLMREDNHQFVAPQYISRFSKNVRHTVENTGLGWETVMRIEAKDVFLPTTCKMIRPQK
jgi:branched-chain amino acid transport system substrate-binding protein